MKKANKLALFCFALLAVAGCNQTSASVESSKEIEVVSSDIVSLDPISPSTLSSIENNSLDNSLTSNEVTSNVTSESGVDDNCPIDHIEMLETHKDVFLGVRSSFIMIDIVPVTGRELTIDEKQVTWKSHDENVAIVDEYGRVTGKSIGRTIVEVTTVIGGKSGKCVIDVYNSLDDIQKEYVRVDDITTIAPGDIVVIACPEQGVVATYDNAHKYLHSASTTFSSNKSKITNLPDEALTLMIDDGELLELDDGRLIQSYTLENQFGEYLVTNSEKKVYFKEKGNKVNTDWVFSTDEEGLYIESTSNVSGQIMYNSKQDKFTVYDSNPQIDMFLPTLYRLERVK